MIVRKTRAELEKMRQSGLLVWNILQKLGTMAVEGVSTLELEIAAEKMIADAGARAAFKGYFVQAAGERYRFALCTSINDEIVHGIPSKKRVIKEGDLVSIDIGVRLDGYYTDSATTVPVGNVDAESRRLLSVTREALAAGIAAATAENHIGDIGAAVQKVVEAAGFSVVRELVGHGIGVAFHEEPQVPNYGKPKRGFRLAPGLTIAIEPMVNIGKPGTRTLPDKWTVVTADG